MAMRSHAWLYLLFTTGCRSALGWLRILHMRAVQRRQMAMALVMLKAVTVALHPRRRGSRLLKSRAVPLEELPMTAEVRQHSSTFALELTVRMAQTSLRAPWTTTADSALSAEQSGQMPRAPCF